MEKPLALGIIGHPIGHTLSPIMHTVAAAYHGIELSYSAYDVKPENLSRAIDGIYTLSIDGINVTVPHKMAVMEFLDHVDDEAKIIGAVNTITREKGKLVGHNTDAYGFITSLKENAGVDPKGKWTVVYGAGGAARAIVIGLAMAGAERITIVNRTESKAVRLAVDAVQVAPDTTTQVAGADTNKLFESVSTADIIINATSVGMGAGGESLPGVERINENHLVADIVYSSSKTELLKQAEKAGARTLDGLWMLIHQGAAAFRLWTGKSFPVDQVREALVSKF